MPIEEDNWSDLMKKVKTLAYKIKNEERASYNFRNVYFLDEMLTAHEKVRILKVLSIKFATNWQNDMMSFQKSHYFLCCS